MYNIKKVINVTEKHDEKIESLKREIADYEKELTFLRIKNESNPGKKLFWTILETIGWIFIILTSFLIITVSVKDPFGFIILIIIETPSVLITLLFKHFKSMYSVKEDSLILLEDKILLLKRELEKVNEEKRVLINNSKEVVINNIEESQKECPMCAELIKIRAKICRFCGYSFELNIDN